MTNDRLEALLWARIDGTLDPQELAELEARLAEHPQPSEIEHHIETIAKSLDRLDTVQPPPDLRGKIDGALSHANPPVANRTVTPHVVSAASWPARWLPLAACLLVGVAIGYLLNPATGDVDRSGVTGSMLTPSALPESAPQEILLEGGAGSVVANRSGADIVVDITLNAQVDLGVTLAGADGGSVRLVTVSSMDGAGTNVTTDDRWVALRTTGPGVMAFTVSTTQSSEVLRLQASVDGTPIAERWIGP